MFSAVSIGLIVDSVSEVLAISEDNIVDPAYGQRRHRATDT